MTQKPGADSFRAIRRRPTARKPNPRRRAFLDSCEAKGAIEAHDLRTRRAGRMTFIDFHLVVDGSSTVSIAHDICDRLEKVIKAEIGESLITIHVEPDHKAKHSGVMIF
jgi:divalent metal cation (Fe/Co/Zn/Cd) transporter